MRKKLWIAVILLAAGLVSQWLTVNAFSDNFREKAEQHLQEILPGNIFWEWKNPRITKETPFYDVDDTNPNYIEYKISCDNEEDCGYLMYNIDWSDVDVPIAAFSGKTISERLNWWNNSWDIKNYYFWMFNQFATDSKWNIWYVNPAEEKAVKDDMSTSISRGSQINSLSTKATLEQRNNSIKSNFNSLREAVKSSKEKNKVKHSLDKLQNQASFARNQLQAYGSDYGFVRWDIVWEGCTSLVPCYTQTYRDYPSDRIRDWVWPRGVTWCTPTALSIIMWYYDRNWYPNMVSWYDPAKTEKHYYESDDNDWERTIRELQTKLWDAMNTYLSKSWWSTNTFRIPYWIYYIRDNTYSYNPRISYNVIRANNSLFWSIKSEIKSGRPLLVSLSIDGEDNWHSIVVYGYYKDSLIANFWWWANISANLRVNMNWNNYTVNWKWWNMSWVVEEAFGLTFNY